MWPAVAMFIHTFMFGLQYMYINTCTLLVPCYLYSASDIAESHQSSSNHFDFEKRGQMNMCDASTSGTPKAARAVHLWYDLPRQATSVNNEVSVIESDRGSYFCVIGFRRGYCGIQERRNGRKVVIFSVWDSKTNDDPPPDKRVKVLYHGDDVKVSRFGGEGTGAKTVMDYDWKIGEPVKFRVEAELDSEGVWTSYSCYVFHKDKDSWYHVARLQTITNGILLRGIYSFVEDFRRDGKSFHERRSAHFGLCTCNSAEGEFVCKKARFTASKSTASNINAGCCLDKFFLETGADTENTHVKLSEFVVLQT